MTATASETPDPRLGLHPAHRVPDGFPPEEWAVRCDLAAAYRLSALYELRSFEVPSSFGALPPLYQ